MQHLNRLHAHLAWYNKRRNLAQLFIMNAETAPSHQDKKFSPLIFTIVLAGSYLTCVLALRLFGIVVPSFWNAQIHARILSGTFIALVVIFKALNALIETLFHRYVLHAPVVTYFLLRNQENPGVVRLWIADFFFQLYVKHHKRHHMLTNITTKGRAPHTTIVNRYPIIHEHQYEASYFPKYTYFAFALPAQIIYIPLQLMFPDKPIMLAGLTSLALSLAFYEFRHAADHWPEERLAKMFKRRFVGNFLKFCFKFHRGHHLVMSSNMAISGWFGIDIWDRVFNTRKIPKGFLENGSPVNPDDLVPPTPRFFIRWMDRIAENARAFKMPRSESDSELKTESETELESVQ